MKVLGIDPGLAILGFGVIEKNNNKYSVLDYGVIKTSKDVAFPTRLKQIYNSICDLIERYNPDAVAVEELFFNKNVSSAFPVASARGVALVACANAVENLYEYTPLQIKLALTGHGRAEKQQVQYMVKAILNLQSIPKPDDAADALAVALCHMETNLLLNNTKIK